MRWKRFGHFVPSVYPKPRPLGKTTDPKHQRQILTAEISKNSETDRLLFGLSVIFAVKNQFRCGKASVGGKLRLSASRQFAGFAQALP